MAMMSSEIIADVTEHIQRFGGDLSTWRVGTAQDAHNPLFDIDRLKDSLTTPLFTEKPAPPPAP